MAEEWLDALTIATCSTEVLDNLDLKQIGECLVIGENKN